MNVPLLDLQAQYATIQAELEAAALKALRATRYILGPEVGELERDLAAYTGAKHVIGCASGSDALLLALMALDVGPGDEVITTPHTFFATVSAIVRLGATPVFVDIDSKTFNINPAGIAAKLTKRTKAILPVHLFGQCADMDAILKLGLPVIEDAAQAIGAKYRPTQTTDHGPQTADNGPQRVRRSHSALSPSTLLGTVSPSNRSWSKGSSFSEGGSSVSSLRSVVSGLPSSPVPGDWRQAGTMGTLGTFSFFPSKNLGGAGDGGAITTHDDALAEKLRILRVHGSEPKYYHQLVGVNSRLDTLQAAILRVKLKHLDGWTAARQRNAARYDARFRELGLAGPTPGPSKEGNQPNSPPPEGMGVGGRSVILPHCHPACTHIYNQYTIRVPQRDALREHLKNASIGTEIYYPVPLHLQECFANLGHRPGDFPEAERAAAESLALPIYPELTGAMIDYVAETIAKFVK